MRWGEHHILHTGILGGVPHSWKHGHCQEARALELCMSVDSGIATACDTLVHCASWSLFSGKHHSVPFCSRQSSSRLPLRRSQAPRLQTSLLSLSLFRTQVSICMPGKALPHMADKPLAGACPMHLYGMHACASPGVGHH